MKRGNVSSRERKPTPDPVIIRVMMLPTFNSEPMRVFDVSVEPAIGQVIRAVPTRLRKKLFARLLRVVGLAEQNGVTIFNCEPEVQS